MVDLKSLFQRIKKNPETIHIKGIRFLKRNIFYKFPQKEVNYSTITFNTKHLFQETTLKEKEILQEAEDIIKGEYDILGKRYRLEKIDWYKDVYSGKVWEKKHWRQVKYDLPEENADKKIPWELSKCHHFITLGLAYQQSKEKKYFEEYKKQFLSWITENPYQMGINWVTPMECAIRVVNWIEAYYLFKEEYDENLKNALIKQLYLHGKHIRENLEWSPVKENHYLSDLMGLFFIGITLENYKEAEKWKVFAQKELEKEILTQVSTDGVDDEASLNYHRLVTEILLLCHILAEKTNNSFSESYKKRLEHMCEFIMYYTSPTGKAPSFGDTDNGRVLHIWHKDTNDHRDLLSLASVLFKRGDFKAKGKYHTKMQLLISSEEYNKILSEEKELLSKAFTDWYIIRDADIFLMIHCGSIGRKGFGGHGHNDQLAFVFSTKNKDYIIDLGTYSYTSDKKKRHFLRSTGLHNTVVLDGKEQNDIREKTPFNMEHKTKAICFQWQSDKIQDVFIGKHFGYSPNVLTREIHYEKRKKEITITERLKDDAAMELNVYFDPSVKVKQEGYKIFLDEEIEMEIETPGTIEKAIYSREYGHISDTKGVKIKKQGNNLITKIRLKKEPIVYTKKEELPRKEKTIIKEKPKKESPKSVEEEYY